MSEVFEIKGDRVFVNKTANFYDVVEEIRHRLGVENITGMTGMNLKVIRGELGNQIGFRVGKTFHRRYNEGYGLPAKKTFSQAIYYSRKNNAFKLSKLQRIVNWVNQNYDELEEQREKSKKEIEARLEEQRQFEKNIGLRDGDGLYKQYGREDKYQLTLILNRDEVASIYNLIRNVLDVPAIES